MNMGLGADLVSSIPLAVNTKFDLSAPLTLLYANVAARRGDGNKQQRRHAGTSCIFG
jgi:hypothetical protein